MSTASNQIRVYLQHRRLMFWSFLLPIFGLVPLAIWAHVQGESAAPASLLALFGLTMSVAFFLASVQQEMLSKAFCFLTPGLAGGMVRNQVLTGIAVAVVTFAASFLVPGLAAIIQGSVALGWSLAILTVMAYTLTLLVVFQFAYASWLPFQVVWGFFLIAKPLMRVWPEQLQALLSQTTLLSVVAALSIYLAWQQMHSRALRRKLAQRPYISLADLRNTDRMDEFKRARNLHKVQKDEGVRPLDGLLQGLKRRAVSSRETGDRAQALVAEAAYLTLATAIPRAWWKLATMLGVFVAAMALFGYFDSRVVTRGDSTLNGWFTGMLFMGTTGVSMVAYHLRVRTMGRLFARRDMLRAGWLGAGVMLAAGLVGSLLLFGLGHVMAAVLPRLTFGWDVYYMIGPRWYLLGNALFLVPVQLLVFVLWRKPGSQMVLQQTGTLAFMLYHAVFNWAGPDLILVPAALVTGALWLILAWAWRWRVWRKDMV